MTSPEFLIEGILPANEIHLLGGSSGSGKTTLVFQTLAAWQEEQDVFGHKSNYVPYSYVSLDRSRSSVDRTLERLDLNAVITRVICQEDLPNVSTITEVVAAVRKIHSDSIFFVVEGFQTLVGDKGNSYAPVAGLLKRSATLCSKEQVTILGIAHSPKMKIDESFKHSRELILGSVAWGAYSDTIVTVQLDETKGNIAVNILPRNAPSEQHNYVFGVNGVLLPLDSAKPKEALLLRIESLGHGRSIMRQEILEWADQLNTSRSTADRAITDCLKNKVLETLSPGIYARTNRVPLKSVSNEEFTVNV